MMYEDGKGYTWMASQDGSWTVRPLEIARCFGWKARVGGLGDIYHEDCQCYFEGIDKGR